MKKWLIAIIIIVLLVGGLYIYDYEIKTNMKEGPLVGGGGEQFKPCLWVFKTNADYSDLQFINFFNENMTAKDIETISAPGIDVPNIGIHSAGSNPFYKLNQGYIGYGYGCFFPKYFAFTSISMSKWKNELEACANILKEYKENLVLKNCNDSKFLWKIEKYSEKTEQVEEGVAEFIWEGKISARAQTGGECIFNLSGEEQSEFAQQEKNWEECSSGVSDKYSKELSVSSIIDKNPFTEFYLCNVKLGDINSTISNNELSTKCEKKK